MLHLGLGGIRVRDWREGIFLSGLLGLRGTHNIRGCGYWTCFDGPFLGYVHMTGGPGLSFGLGLGKRHIGSVSVYLRWLID
jgi:hypothetical protein